MHRQQGKQQGGRNKGAGGKGKGNKGNDGDKGFMRTQLNHVLSTSRWVVSRAPSVLQLHTAHGTGQQFKAGFKDALVQDLNAALVTGQQPSAEVRAAITAIDNGLQAVLIGVYPQGAGKGGQAGKGQGGKKGAN